MKPKPTFSMQDAQALVNQARSAPLANMAHAENVHALIERFVTWYDAVRTPKKKVGPSATPNS